jgi:hypothetical protein
MVFDDAPRSSDNFITSLGAAALCRALMKNTTLRSIALCSECAKTSWFCSLRFFFVLFCIGGVCRILSQQKGELLVYEKRFVLLLQEGRAILLCFSPAI